MKDNIISSLLYTEFYNGKNLSANGFVEMLNVYIVIEKPKY